MRKNTPEENKRQEMWQEALEPSCELMSKEGLTKKPRFSVGDRVVAVGPTIAYCGNQGVVIKIVEPAGDLVYRYVVRFANGTTDTFFGFELQLV